MNDTMSLSEQRSTSPRRRRRALVALALTLGPLGAASACNQTGPPPGQTCRAVEFTGAKVSSATGRYVLTVTGTLRSISDRARLVPVTYARQPEYWAISVQECGGPNGLGAMGPYTATLDVTNTLGTRGVQVIGMNRAVNIDLATWDRPTGGG